MLWPFTIPNCYRTYLVAMVPFWYFFFDTVLCSNKDKQTTNNKNTPDSILFIQRYLIRKTLKEHSMKNTPYSSCHYLFSIAFCPVYKWTYSYIPTYRYLCMYERSIYDTNGFWEKVLIGIHPMQCIKNYVGLFSQ